MNRPESPCIRVCEMDAASGLCRGCARTLDEIARWGQASPAERDAVWQALPARRAQWGWTPPAPPSPLAASEPPTP